MQTEASKEINSIFPDNLRSPVLHYAQFQDHHRMDDLGKQALYIVLSSSANSPS